MPYNTFLGVTGEYVRFVELFGALARVRAGTQRG